MILFEVINAKLKGPLRFSPDFWGVCFSRPSFPNISPQPPNLGTKGGATPHSKSLELGKTYIYSFTALMITKLDRAVA